MLLLRLSGGVFAGFLLVCGIGLGYVRQAPSTAMRLAYVSDQNGPSQIYIMDFYGQQVRALTDGAGDDLDPAWSPADNFVAFASFRGQASTIYLIPPDGGPLIEIALAVGSAINPQWSPRGDYLVFERFTNRGDRSLVGYEVATQDLNLLTTPAQSDWFPVWAADADRVLYLTAQGAHDQLMTLNIRDETTQALTDTERTYQHPTWSPDGRFVAYETSEGDIWRLDVATGRESPLTATPQRETMPAWSPAGDWIAFLRDADDGSRHVYRVDPEGGNLLRLSNPAQVDLAVGALRWSNEGAWLAYVGVAPTARTTAIYRVGANGATHARLTPHAYNSSSPSWSPALDRRLGWGWLAIVGFFGILMGVGMAGLHHVFSTVQQSS